MTVPAPPRVRPSRWRKVAFAVVPLLALLAVGELVARLVRAPLHFGSFRQLRVDLLQRGYPAQLDPDLGYVPAPNYASHDNHWGTQVTIGADGCRSNGGPPPAGPLVVAVGDSFTFGDQVDDRDTWPACLERRLGQPVRNGGVFGYSMAQSVLRAEALLEERPAQWLVVSVYTDDIVRNEFSRRYASVPWFDLQDGALVLQNVPVVDAHDADELRRRAWKDALGCSALVDAFCANAFRQWWVEDQKQVRAHPPGRGREIAVLLVDRIQSFCLQRGARLLLVLQGQETTDDAEAVFAHARAAGVRTCDLIAAYREELARDPTATARLFAGHMTAAGNDWAAAHIAAAMRDG
ncbi:MAG: hypothetical protein AB7O97_07330 [Planctomycetota bacterium]